MLLLGLRLASDLLGTTPPEEVLHKVQADRAVRTLDEQVYRPLFSQASGQTGLFEGSLFQPLYLKRRELTRQDSLLLPGNDDRDCGRLGVVVVAAVSLFFLLCG